MLLEKLRRIFRFHVALGAFLVLWIYMLAGREVGDPDIWWHLWNARYLLTTGHLPNVDMLSYTAQGHAWLNHEWLGEIPYYLVWRAAGLQGILVLSIALVEVILLGLFYLATKESGNVKSAALACWLAGLLAVVSFGPRTILFGYVLMLALLLLLRRYRVEGRAPLWALPLLFCVWANTHGSWLLGLIVYGLFVASGLVEGTWGNVVARKWSPQQLKGLIAAGGASVVALFLNPYGYRLVYYPFDLAFRQKLNVQNVEEWASVNFHVTRGKVVLALLAVLALGILMRQIRWTLQEVALGAFALYLGLTYIRFLFLLAIIITPMVAKLLDFLPPYEPEIDKPVANAVVCAAVLFILVARFPTRAQLAGAVAEKFPTDALTFVKAHPLQGHVFNEYIWGGYIAWNAPEVKTFIDSRTDIFEYVGAFKDYLDTINIRNPLAVFRKYDVRYVMMSSKSAVAYLLENTGGWKMIYSDNVTKIFERNDASVAGQPDVSTKPAAQALGTAPVRELRPDSRPPAR